MPKTIMAIRLRMENRPNLRSILSKNFLFLLKYDLLFINMTAFFPVPWHYFTTPDALMQPTAKKIKNLNYIYNNNLLYYNI